MHTLEILLFGKPIVRCGAVCIELPAKAKELLCYLLLHRGRAQTREALATELWREASATQAKKYLRQTLWQLQQALETYVTAPMLLQLDRDWISIHPEAAVAIDAYQLDDACSALIYRPAAAFDLARAQTAAGLYRGELLAGWYQDWCLIERERYQALYFALLDHIVDDCAAASQFDAGIAYALQLLRLEPEREQTHRRLMRLYALAGDRSAALRQFEICAAVLEKEFGVQPTERTMALREQIRDDRLDAGGHAPEAAQAPSAQLTHPAQLLAELTSIRTAVSTLQRDMEQIKQVLRR